MDPHCAVSICGSGWHGIPYILRSAMTNQSGVSLLVQGLSPEWTLSLLMLSFSTCAHGVRTTHSSSTSLVGHLHSQFYITCEALFTDWIAGLYGIARNATISSQDWEDKTWNSVCACTRYPGLSAKGQFFEMNALTGLRMFGFWLIG